MREKIRLFWYVTRLSIATAFALLMPLSAAPVHAASPGGPAPQPVTAGSISEAKAAFAALPKPTDQQLAAAKAWLTAHPKMQGTVEKLSPPPGVRAPLVSGGFYWWGLRLHLTRDDVHNIWDLIWAAGIGAAAAILCAPGGWLAVFCAIVGAVLAYIVAELIWNYIGYWVPACGVHIDYNWWGGFSWGYC